VSSRHPSIGSLRHRVILETPSRADDGGGGAIVTWLPVAEIWAAIMPLSGTEGVTADGLSARVSHALVVRYRAGIAPAMRFRYGARTLGITAVIDPDERHRYLRCLCREDYL
jgi:SPP1 family predicted phage head-tail adaptor